MTTRVAPQGCTNLKLRQLSRLVSRHFDQYLSTVGLKGTQYALLTCVVKLGPLRPGELARRLHMDASTMSRNLKPMVAQGWLAVGAGDDARSRLVEATAAGTALRTDAQRAWKAAQTALNQRLGPVHVAALHDLLDASIGSWTTAEPSPHGTDGLPCSADTLALGPPRPWPSGSSGRRPVLG